MKRSALAFHAFVACTAGITTVLCWGLMAVIGRGSWLSLTRGLRVGPMYLSSLLLALASLILIPACMLSTLRLLQHRGRLARWNTLAGASTAVAWQALFLGAVLLAFDTPWADIAHTNWRKVLSSLGKPPVLELSDARLNYPQLPLQTIDYYAWTVYNLDGIPVPMASFQGKVLFLSFWATWCIPCRSEIPSMHRLYESLKDKNVAFAFVTREDAQTVRAFQKEMGYAFPVYIMKEPPPATFGVSAYPATFIFAPDGRLAYRHAYAAQWDTPKTIDFLTRLAGTDVATP